MYNFLYDNITGKVYHVLSINHTGENTSRYNNCVQPYSNSWEIPHIYTYSSYNYVWFNEWETTLISLDFLCICWNLLHIRIHIYKKSHLVPIIHLYILVLLYIQRYFCIHNYKKSVLYPNIHLYILITLYIRRNLCASLSPTPENIIHTINCQNLHTCPSYVATLSENVASKTQHGMEQPSMEFTARACTGTKSTYCAEKTRCIYRNLSQTKETLNQQKYNVIQLTNAGWSSNHQQNVY